MSMNSGNKKRKIAYLEERLKQEEAKAERWKEANAQKRAQNAELNSKVFDLLLENKNLRRYTRAQNASALLSAGILFESVDLAGWVEKPRRSFRPIDSVTIDGFRIPATMIALNDERQIALDADSTVTLKLIVKDELTVNYKPRGAQRSGIHRWFIGADSAHVAGHHPHQEGSTDHPIAHPDALRGVELVPGRDIVIMCSDDAALQEAIDLARRRGPLKITVCETRA